MATHETNLPLLRSPNFINDDLRYARRPKKGQSLIPKQTTIGKLKSKLKRKVRAFLDTKWKRRFTLLMDEVKSGRVSVSSEIYQAGWQDGWNARSRRGKWAPGFRSISVRFMAAGLNYILPEENTPLSITGDVRKEHANSWNLARPERDSSAVRKLCPRRKRSFRRTWPSQSLQYESRRRMSENLPDSKQKPLLSRSDVFMSRLPEGYRGYCHLCETFFKTIDELIEHDNRKDGKRCQPKHG